MMRTNTGNAERFTPCSGPNFDSHAPIRTLVGTHNGAKLAQTIAVSQSVKSGTQVPWPDACVAGHNFSSDAQFKSEVQPSPGFTVTTPGQPILTRVIRFGLVSYQHDHLNALPRVSLPPSFQVSSRMFEPISSKPASMPSRF